MKKTGLLNSNIERLLTTLRHTDSIVIADCGLPIPAHVPEIDIAVALGEPSFMRILELIRDNMQIESVVLAEEIKMHNSGIHQTLTTQFDDITYVSHEQFKIQTKNAKAIIRTGEATPYANIILRSGVIF